MSKGVIEFSRKVSSRTIARVARALECEGMQGRAWYAVHEDDLQQIASEAVLDVAWAFRPRFLASYTGLPVEIFEALVANNRSEGNNETILTLIRKVGPGLSRFAQEAIEADGVGHFLSPYDGEEHALVVGKNRPVRWHLFRRE